MNRNFLIVILLLSVALGNVKPLQACTSVIVSGKATKDGRPLIFKNRDTSILHNMTIVVQGRVYRYIGLVNAEDTAPVNVWGGHNEAGFGIINTAAYNLNGDGGDTDGDGILIRKALELCATLDDFERLLDTVKKPREVNSNLERFCAITDFMAEACKEGNLEHDYLITSISRYLKHGVRNLICMISCLKTRMTRSIFPLVITLPAIPPLR